MTVVYVLLQRYYIPAARELQRLEAVSRSPIYAGFSEAVAGLPTIRAFGREAHFVALEDRLIATNGLLFLTQRAGRVPSSCMRTSCEHVWHQGERTDWIGGSWPRPCNPRHMQTADCHHLPNPPSLWAGRQGGSQ